MGGGSLPGETIPSWALALHSSHLSAQELLVQLRSKQPPVMARIVQDRVLFDPRTVLAEQDEEVAATAAKRGETMFIMGTAGHIDHGKTTLITALTGINPDRLQEEQARGMTVDLGFAWFSLPKGTVGIVDVPGHHRLVKNMLAGVGRWILSSWSSPRMTAGCPRPRNTWIFSISTGSSGDLWP